MRVPSRFPRVHFRLWALSAATGLVAALGWAVPASATHAQRVYHSPNDNGQPAGGLPELPSGGVQSLYLYIDGGALASAPSTACDTGAGSEVCGYTLTLTGMNGATFTGFTPDGGANLLYDLNGSEFRINGLDTQSPTPGAKRIGELLVNGVEGASVELSSGEVIGADLSSELLSTDQVVYLPEPGVMLMLASTLAVLGCLGRGRARP
jgi:hypothetical protein